MKIYNHLYMGNFKSALVTLGAATLAACNNAEAADANNAPEKAGLPNMAAVVETTKITRKQCIALLPDNEQLKACMLELSAQNKAEIAAKTEQRQTHASELTTLETEIKEGTATVEALTNQVEGLKKVVKIQERDNR